jgi:hypothetical protein
MTREERIKELTKDIEAAKRERDLARVGYLDAIDALDDAVEARRAYMKCSA